MRKYKRVEVEWSDATHYSGARSCKEAKNDCGLTTFKTLGYLLRKGRKVLIITGEYNQFDDVRDTNIIPRSDVVKITYLREDE